MKQITYILMLCINLSALAQTQVDIKLNVRHKTGEIDSFDRSKFITIHANHTETEWDGDNFVDDLRDDFLNGYDVYLGRDTGGITWNLNYMPEDPDRPGYADPASINSKGTTSKNSYAAKTTIHQYENRRNHVIAAQLHPFWTGESQVPTKLGWELASPTATGEFMGRYLNAFHGGNGQPQSDWVEVINEPAYEALGGKTNYTNSLQEIADFHVEVANAIRAQNENLLIGGYTVAFPDFETGDFQRWTNRDKLFIDVAGEKMDFWSWHLYDFPAFGGKVDLRSGSNLEATFDMNDQYSMMTLTHTKPYVISEYGAQTHDYNNQAWSPYKDWLFLKAQNSMMMSFMERPDHIAIAIPFTPVKAEWGYNDSKDIPYNARLMRKTNEPDNYTGEWIYTNRVKFYQLWQNVKGTRIDTKSEDLDILVDAYIDNNKVYLILNNLEFSAKSIDLNILDTYDIPITSIYKRHLTLTDNAPVLDEETLDISTSNVTLGAESTMILEYTYDSNLTIDELNTEKKYYATTYLQPITANQSISFDINSIEKNTNGEAILRLGLGRDHGSSLTPTVTVNGTEVTVPTDYRGYDQADKNRFFGVIEIPVAWNVLATTNNVSVSFPDSGGHVSSAIFQVFNYSEEVPVTEPFCTWKNKVTNVAPGQNLDLTIDYNTAGKDLAYMQVTLQEMNSSWGVVNNYTPIYPASNDSPNSQEITTTYSIDENATPSDELPDGNFYLMKIFISMDNNASFANDNSQVIMDTEIASIEKISGENQLNIHPNPVKNNLYVDTFKRSLEFHIYAINGTELKTGKTNGVINVSDLDNGMYILTTEYGSEKFIKN